MRYLFGNWRRGARFADGIQRFFRCGLAARPQAIQARGCAHRHNQASGCRADDRKRPLPPDLRVDIEQHFFAVSRSLKSADQTENQSACGVVECSEGGLIAISDFFDQRHPILIARNVTLRVLSEHSYFSHA